MQRTYALSMFVQIFFPKLHRDSAFYISGAYAQTTQAFTPPPPPTAIYNLPLTDTNATLTLRDAVLLAMRFNPNVKTLNYNVL